MFGPNTKSRPLHKIIEIIDVKKDKIKILQDIEEKSESMERAVTGCFEERVATFDDFEEITKYVVEE
jgi:hypothetical protein